MVVRWLACATALVALAGCDPDIAAQPRTRAGLWVMTASLNGRPRPPAPFCDPGHGVVPRPDPDCSQWRPTLTPGDAVVLDAVCAKLGGTMRLHRRIIGDFARAYTDDTTVLGETPKGPTSRVWVRLAYRYQGACPPGMKTASRSAGAAARAGS